MRRSLHALRAPDAQIHVAAMLERR